MGLLRRLWLIRIISFIIYKFYLISLPRCFCSLDIIRWDLHRYSSPFFINDFLLLLLDFILCSYLECCGLNETSYNLNRSWSWQIRICYIIFVNIYLFRNFINTFFLIIFWCTIMWQITPNLKDLNVIPISSSKNILKCSDNLLNESNSVLGWTFKLIIIFLFNMNNKPMIFGISTLSKSLDKMDVNSPLYLIFINII